MKSLDVTGKTMCGVDRSKSDDLAGQSTISKTRNMPSLDSTVIKHACVG
jgi:hypothetical protein